MPQAMPTTHKLETTILMWYKSQSKYWEEIPELCIQICKIWNNVRNFDSNSGIGGNFPLHRIDVKLACSVCKVCPTEPVFHSSPVHLTPLPSAWQILIYSTPKYTHFLAFFSFKYNTISFAPKQPNCHQKRKRLEKGRDKRKEAGKVGKETRKTPFAFIFRGFYFAVIWAGCENRVPTTNS